MRACCGGARNYAELRKHSDGIGQCPNFFGGSRWNAIGQFSKKPKVSETGRGVVSSSRPVSWDGQNRPGRVEIDQFKTSHFERGRWACLGSVSSCPRSHGVSAQSDNKRSNI